MPILAAETSVYPEGLFHDPQLADPDRRWWAMYTKPRQEKSLARDLVQLGLSFYLPLVPKTNLIRGRRVKSLIPLFGGYVFFFGTEEERIRALSKGRVSLSLAAANTKKMTDDLRNVQSLINSGVPLTVEGQLGPGRRVRVISGALMGVEGTILERRGDDRLLVAVSFLQQGVSVLIQDFLVEPA
jgi:transcriptional antiterminator RfaH